MRAHTDQLAKVLKGAPSRRLIADVFHGTERVMQDLPLTSWSLDGDLNAEVKHGGRGIVTHASVAGESLVPVGSEGILSPFRASLLLLMEISAGDFSETITLGWFRITSIPSALDFYGDVNGVSTVISSQVEVIFESLDVNLKRRGFRSEQQPPSLTSVYTELRRITNMPVLETVADKAIPAAIVYEATQGGRLKGVQALSGLLGGVAVVNPSGAIVVVPSVAGASNAELVVGEQGTVMDVPYAIETDTVYNCVVGNFEDANRNPIYAVAEVTIGPMATSAAGGENTRYYASDFVKTQAGADSAVAAILSQSTGQQEFNVDIQCVVNPLLELGDVANVVGHVRPLKGQLVKYSMSDSPLMNVTLSSSRTL